MIKCRETVFQHYCHTCAIYVHLKTLVLTWPYSGTYTAKGIRRTLHVFVGRLTPYNISDLKFETINLLAEFKSNSSPNFIIVNTETYISEINKNRSSMVGNKLLPSSFLLSFSYRPQDNTVLKLLSTRTSRLAANDVEGILEGGDELNKISGTDGYNDVTGLNDDGDDDNLFASMLLSKSALYLQPERSKYYPLWANVTSGRLHNLVFIVSNGSVSSCMDGYFIEDNPKITLWDTSTSIDRHPVRINFTQHLHAIQRRVST